VGLALTLMTFAQSSGREAADTKLDLLVSPVRFLRNALTMWDPTAAAGQLQDQAYGYLFPMGPFFVLGKLSALSPWVVQRAWESALLVAAFLGLVRLARLLGVPGFWPRVAAGLAYALAPRVLMELGVISSELLPVVVLPWVMIPLVQGAVAGSPRRAAARSGVALLFASGINASATLAILPVPLLWLLSRGRGPRRRALTLWWIGAVLLACLWWAVPLVLLGRYSPPFLDWIESSAVTTSATSLVRSLRGVDHWQAYLGPGVWPAGWILAVAPAAILATTAIAAIGVAGSARRRTPHRQFLVTVLVVGLVLVTLGHVTAVGPPFAGSVRHLLDGPLVAFRNVHKFDPVIRLPIAIGVGHAVAALSRRIPKDAVLHVRGTAVTVLPRALAAVAVVGLAAVAITPAIAGRIVPQTRDINEPTWWTQTGTWLGQHEGSGRALVVPGAAQPAYVWGQPRDDALQPVAAGPWTVRDATPLTQPGYIRLLDRVESILAAGAADPTLAPLLARSGIRYVIVRNDLDAGASQATPQRFVFGTLAHSPHFVLAASFGPRPIAGDDPNRLVDLGLSRAGRPVQVYENTDWSSPVSLIPAARTVLSNGSSDELPQLVASGVAATAPVIFGPVPSSAAAAISAPISVLTEGTRRREFGFGGVNQYAATMTVAQPYSVPRAAHDYLPSGVGSLSPVAYDGISNLTVSSAASASESGWAALDGQPGTAWLSRSNRGAVGQWLQIDLPRALPQPSVEIAFAAHRPNYPIRLRVSTESGAVEDDVSPDSNNQTLPLPPGRASRIRLTVLEMANARLRTQVALASVAIRGVLPSRTLVIPGVADPDVVDFAALPGRRSACLTVQDSAACEPSWAAAGEEDDALDRTFRLAAGAEFQAVAGVYLRPGPQLDARLDVGNPVRALASSVNSTDPRQRAGAAVDDNPATGWVAKAGSRLPSIELSTARPETLDGLQISPLAGAPVAAPTRVVIEVGKLTFQTSVPADGRIRFPRPQTASTLRLTVTAQTLRVNTDSASGRRQLLPVGIGEIRLVGPRAPLGRVEAAVHVPCGSGPTLFVNGATVPLRVDAGAAQVLSGAPVSATPCGPGPVPLQRGLNRIRLASDAMSSPASIVLRRPGSTTTTPPVADAGTVHVRAWGSTRREVRVATTGAAFLSVAENANAGWSASLGGRALTAVTLDGWHQGWLVPAGSSGIVRLVFTPQQPVDWGLGLGAIAVLVLLGAAIRRPRAGAPEPSTTSGALSGWRAFGAVTIGLGLLGGITGLVVLAGVLVVRRGGVRLRAAMARAPGEFPRSDVAAVCAATIVLVAGAAEAIAPADSAGPLADTGAVQVLCLLAVALLLVTLLPPTAPRPTEPTKQRPLEHVVRPGSGGGGTETGEDEQGQEVTAEHAPVHPMLDEDQ
jgi:arabinofuranan 3-O-arabinosyltransferase